MTVNQWVAYCLATFVGGIIPGPIMLLAMTAGAKRGVINALPAAMGNVCASIVQVLISIAFVSAIAQTVDALFAIMMAAGGLYLIYLGVNLYRANPFKFSSSTDVHGMGSYVSDFADVFVITLLNPKALLFFVALFPQVIPRDNYSLYLVFAMTISFSVIALLCFIIYAVFGSGIRQLAGNGKLAEVINFVLSAVFVGVGVWAILNAIQGI